MAPIIAEIHAGKTHREIAKRLKISYGLLCEWLNKPEYSEQSARAMLESAEAWLDRGLEAVERTADPTRGRYIAQECARRAGIRNYHYRERMGIDAKVDGNVTIEIVKFGADTDTK